MEIRLIVILLFSIILIQCKAEGKFVLQWPDDKNIYIQSFDESVPFSNVKLNYTIHDQLNCGFSSQILDISATVEYKKQRQLWQDFNKELSVSSILENNLSNLTKLKFLFYRLEKQIKDYKFDLEDQLLKTGDIITYISVVFLICIKIVQI